VDPTPQIARAVLLLSRARWKHLLNLLAVERVASGPSILRKWYSAQHSLHARQAGAKLR